MDETTTRWYRWIADHSQYFFWVGWGAFVGAFAVTALDLGKPIYEWQTLIAGAFAIAAAYIALGGVRRQIDATDRIYRQERNERLTPSAIRLQHRILLATVLELLEADPGNGGMVDALETYLERYLHESRENEFAAMGQEVNSQANLLLATTRMTHLHMGTDAFDANRTATSTEMSGQRHLLRTLIGQLQSAIRSIVGG